MNKNIILLFSILIPVIGHSQKTMLDLNQAIELAQQNSIQSKVIEKRNDVNQLGYLIYKNSRLPQVSFNATLPDLNRSIAAVTLPNGSDAFIQRSQSTSSLGLTVNQRLFTGGNLFLSSDLARIDLLNGTENQKSYLSTPIQIGISQPIFGFNRFKWEKKLQPIVFKEAAQKYEENKENLAIQTTQLYYRALIAQQNYKIAVRNQANNDTLYTISKNRYQIGKIAENELLQIELALTNSQMNASASELNAKMLIYELAQFLGLDPNSDIELFNAKETPDLEINVSKAIQLALLNQADIVSAELNTLNAERDWDKTKKDMRFKMDLFATYGLTQSGTTFNESYIKPQDQQAVRVGISIPLYTGGTNKAQIEQALANKEIAHFNNDLVKLRIKRMIMQKALSFNLLKTQLEIAEKAEKIANKRYKVTKQRYLIGKTSITDINNAFNEKDRAQKNSLQVQMNYWTSFYEMRKLTHYDFILNKAI